MADSKIIIIDHNDTTTMECTCLILSIKQYYSSLHEKSRKGRANKLAKPSGKNNSINPILATCDI